MSARLQDEAGNPVVEQAAATYLLSVAGSAGGFGPLRRLLAALPPDFNAAVVAMLHSGSAGLPETLRPFSRLPLNRAQSGLLLQEGQVYVAAAGTHLIVNPDARLTVSNEPRLRLFRPSADWLFESAAASFGRRHVALVLSGMLWDGAPMLHEVKRTGGTVLVQSPEEADYPEMPQAAIETGCVDAVVAVDDMVPTIIGALAARNRPADAATWRDPFALYE